MPSARTATVIGSPSRARHPARTVGSSGALTGRGPGTRALTRPRRGRGAGRWARRSFGRGQQGSAQRSGEAATPAPPHAAKPRRGWLMGRLLFQCRSHRLPNLCRMSAILRRAPRAPTAHCSTGPGRTTSGLPTRRPGRALDSCGTIGRRHDRAPVHPRHSGLRVSRLPRAALSLHLAGAADNAMLGTSTMVWKLLREETPDYIAVAWDAPGPSVPRAKFAAYKETRPAMPDDLRIQIPYVRRLVRGAPAAPARGRRASRPTTSSARSPLDRVRDCPVDVVLVTADKDMLQLVDPRVRVFTTCGRGGERVVLDEAAVKVKLGVDPGADPRHPRADGRLHRQHPGRAGRRREDRDRSSSASSAASSACTRTCTWCRASCARCSPRIAPRRCSRASWRR